MTLKVLVLPSTVDRYSYYLLDELRGGCSFATSHLLVQVCSF